MKRFFVGLVSLFFILNSNPSYAQRLSQAKMDSLIAEAEQTHSDGLIILHDGKIVVEKYFGQPVTPTYIASVSKALVSMAIVKLLNDKKIASIDQRVADFYPEWKQGQKADITLRMLLSHSSGMQNIRNSRLEIETGPQGAGDDLVKLALAAEITDKPGTVYAYNNKATCLLPGIILQASGKRMDAYFEETFFRPMGITNYEWKKDGAGTPQGHGGFKLLPMDLAKFGQLMLDRGQYKGIQFFDGRWVDSSITASQQVNPEIGLIWHRYIQKEGNIQLNASLVSSLQKKGMADSIVVKLNTLSGKVFTNESALGDALANLLGADWFTVLTAGTKEYITHPKELFIATPGTETVRGYYHTGSWGNYLVIVPHLKLVAVRLVKRDKAYNETTDLFGNFVRMVFDLEEGK